MDSETVAALLQVPLKYKRQSTRRLHPGARFTGTQTSGKQQYKVHVEIKNVDLDQGLVAGFLEIEGLTQVLTTNVVTPQN